ncbi:MAG: hypothetical protein V4699_00075 [Patescibacteria group bacterium]
MPKNLFQDMVKVKRTNRPSRPKPVLLERGEIAPERPPQVEQSAGKTKYALWIVAGISILFLFFALSYLFMSARVTINPKTQNTVLNENLSASKDSNNDGLSFNLVVIGGEESKILQANGEQDVSKRATGKVMIYNAFSSAPQLLSIDTRLEGSNGKIYKTEKKLVVPGMKGTTPGSIEVGIYASVAGAEYNSAPLDFKIFGFKGTPKYSKFYARSKGDITGGFVGKAPVVSPADLAIATNDLKTALQAKLLQKAIDQIPDGFILFKDAIFLNTGNSNNEPDIASTYNNDNTMTLTLKGTLDGILLNEQKLTNKIVTDKVDKYDGSDVYIPNIRALTFSLSNKDSVSFGDVKNISFNLSGPATIVWRVDEGQLIADLLGKTKKDFNQILSQYPNINSADLVVSPFWVRSLSEKSKDIKVIVNYPN